MQTLKHHVGYSRENECWFVRFYPYQTEQQAKDAVYSFTRPAAPVEGLDTVAWENYDDKRNPNDKLVYELPFPRNGDKRLVYKHQAEAIIAERDAEIDRMKKINAMIMGDDENAPRYTTKRLKQEVERVTQVMRGEAADREAHVKTLQSDNATLTARVKHFEDEIKIKGGNEHAPTQDAYELACKAIDKHRVRAEALETQLAAAKEREEHLVSLLKAFTSQEDREDPELRAALEDKP